MIQRVLSGLRLWIIALIVAITVVVLARASQISGDRSDPLVIAWWLLFFANVSFFFILLIMQGRLNRQAAALDADAPTVLSTFPKPVRVTAVTCLVVLLLLQIPLAWASHWAALLFANYQLGAMWLGSFSIIVGISPGKKTFKALWLPRIALIYAGLLFGGLAAYFTFNDWFLPRRAVDGQIEEIKETRGFRGVHRFYITMNGRQYETLREVFLRTSRGDHVTAQIGRGSNTIMDIQAIGH